MYCRNCGSQNSEGGKFCKNCGCDLTAVPSSAKEPVKRKSGIRPVVGVAALLVAVVCVTAVILHIFNGQMDQTDLAAADMQGKIDTENDPAKETQIGTSREEKTGYSQEDYDKAAEMADILSMEWYVKKYYDGEEWNTYELGKKMAIVAFNFLNDITIETGGYSYLTGEQRLGVRKYKYYTYVPRKVTTYHGKDIEYSCPTIIITRDYVDMSGMDGPVFDISDFRYENINGEDFLINDSANFALMYDGRYLEYCEPDAYGYYQGYYAFDMFDSLVNATVEY